MQLWGSLEEALGGGGDRFPPNTPHIEWSRGLELTLNPPLAHSLKGPV